MRHQEFGWQNPDGLQIFAQSWQPDIAPASTVCLVHGQGEHSSRYTHVAAALNAAGVAVITFDLPGHGQSEGKRGDMSSYDALLDDIEQLLQEAEQQFPSIPLFLYGHSMGGNLVLNYALRRQPAVVAVIATSPWLRLAFSPPFLQFFLMRLVSYAWSSVTIQSTLDPAALSRDPAVVTAYQQDPLVHSYISARQFIQVYQAGEWALEHAHEFPQPLLLLHGSQDRITSPEATHYFATQVTGDCTFKLWDDLFHETHNEPEQKEVIAYLITWLQAHTPM